MKKLVFIFSIFAFISISYSQTFTRAVEYLGFSWNFDISVGPDNYIYYNHWPGAISRYNPNTKEKKEIYVFEDMIFNHSGERLPLCPNESIKFGPLGLDLDPDFTNPERAFIYTMYSYNAGTNEDTITNFKIIRLKWDENTETITESVVLIDGMKSGYQHMGGRIIAKKENDETYVYYTIGDLAHTEDDCYDPPESSPKWLSLDPNEPNGKVNRIMWDGTIPEDNPISGNPYWTRGHRNPQGITYNPETGLIYTCEHGDATDDEVNLLQKGMNFGWPMVSGNHDDNYPGELDSVNNYNPHPEVQNDKLVEPLYNFCDELIGYGATACTIAPGSIEYYGSDAIPEWTNSLLVTTLKNAKHVDQGVWLLRLNEEGTGLVESTEENPNPVQFFAEDQDINGRLRDIAISNDGTKIYIVNAGPDEIAGQLITYSTGPTASVFSKRDDILFPNPANEIIYLGIGNIELLEIYDISGNLVLSKKYPEKSFNISGLNNGLYIAKLKSGKDQKVVKLIKN